MEPYPFHYTRRSRVGDSVNPTVKFVFEERLDDRIEGRRQGIDHRMADSEHRVEERLISLEMARMESETGRTEIEKQVEGLKLKVHHVGRFLERENLGDPQGKPGIFRVVESTPPPPPHQATDADGPTGHRIEHHSGISSWGRLPAILRSRSTVRLSPDPTSMLLILLLSGFKVLLENLLE
jgi:hypothetical protein